MSLDKRLRAGSFTSDNDNLVLDTFKGAVWDLKAGHDELWKMFFAMLAFNRTLIGYS